MGPMLEMGIGHANVFAACRWAVLRAPEESSFITTDDPVVHIFPPRNGFYPTPPLSPEVSKLIPLAHDVLLMIHGEGATQLNLPIGRAEVRGFNVAVASASQEIVVARDEALLRSIVKKAHLESRRIRPQIEIG